MEVLEGARQTLEQSGLALVAVEVDPELARGTQQASERVHRPEHASDGDTVGRPVDLHLFTRTGFEAALDGLCRCESQLLLEGSYLSGENAPLARVPLRADLAQDPGDGQPFDELVLDRLEEGVELARRGGWGG